MHLHIPQSIDEAVALLGGDPEARCLSGGQTLVAMMNADLVEPSVLVSLKRIASLQGISAEPGGWIRIGAMTTHDTIARSTECSGAASLMSRAAARIAHPAIRSVGTIGGSIAHADPAADFPTAIVALDAAIELAGPRGTRRVAARDFFVDYLQTILKPGELIVAVHLPPTPRGTVSAYEKLARVDGDFAIVSAAVVLGMTDGVCAHVSLAAGGCGSTPIRSDAAEARLLGCAPDDIALTEALALFAQACDPVDDIRATAVYRLTVIQRLFRRAIGAACAELAAAQTPS